MTEIAVKERAATPGSIAINTISPAIALAVTAMHQITG